MKILGIETSCDECSVALLTFEKSNTFGSISVDSLNTFSQIEIHRPYGGVVPEIASRNHLETFPYVLQEVLKNIPHPKEAIDLIAVTNRPGLVGALLVGVTAAKSLAYAWEKPLVAVHHLEGHLASLFLGNDLLDHFELPCLVAVISGGHTQLHLLRAPPWKWTENTYQESRISFSLDDAAGEAFDKCGKILGLPYPAGREIDVLAQNGNADAYPLPKALKQKDNFNFSFSGLKTAFANQVTEARKRAEKKGQTFEAVLPDLCASVQSAIIDQIVSKILTAAKFHRCRSIGIVGGVAANSLLRLRMQREWSGNLYFPKLEFCTDNAAMIGLAGLFQFIRAGALNHTARLDLNAIAYPDLENRNAQ